MKNYTIMAFIAGLLLTACNVKTNKSAENSTEAEKVIVYDNLLNEAEGVVDKTVKIKGHVTHTCKHSGKRAFLVGDNEKFTVRVEAGGKIEGFDKSLEGNTLIVTGTLKERRLTKEYIDQWEEELKHKAEDGSAESCKTEMNNINDMRAWMKENGKDHYSIYFVEGSEYEVVE